MIHNAITEEVKNMKKWKAPVIIALTAEDLAKHTSASAWSLCEDDMVFR